MMVRSPAISAHKRRSLSQRARRDAEAEQRDPAPAYPPHGTVVGEVVLRLTPCSARHAIVRKHCARGLLILNDDERMIAALYVEPSGVYSGLENVDPWDEARDARKYSGPHPVVAHPPCQRWGKFWHGSTRKPHQYRLGEERGCLGWCDEHRPEGTAVPDSKTPNDQVKPGRRAASA